MERLTAADLSMILARGFWVASRHRRDRHPRRNDPRRCHRSLADRGDPGWDWSPPAVTDSVSSTPVHTRRGLGWPLWVDADSVDMGHHVDVFPFENPDEAEFLVVCEGLRRRSLDRSQPLWVMWLLPSLPEGRIGLFMKLHHAVADGVAGVAAFGAFLDLTPAAAAPPAPQWTPTPIPTNDELFRDNVSRRVRLRARSCLGSPIRRPRCRRSVAVGRRCGRPSPRDVRR